MAVKHQSYNLGVAVHDNDDDDDDDYERISINGIALSWPVVQEQVCCICLDVLDFGYVALLLLLISLHRCIYGWLDGLIVCGGGFCVEVHDELHECVNLAGCLVGQSLRLPCVDVLLYEECVVMSYFVEGAVPFIC